MHLFGQIKDQKARFDPCAHDHDGQVFALCLYARSQNVGHHGGLAKEHLFLEGERLWYGDKCHRFESMGGGKDFGLLQRFLGNSGNMGAAAETLYVDDQFIKAVGGGTVQFIRDVGVCGLGAVDGDIFDLVQWDDQLGTQTIGRQRVGLFAQISQISVKGITADISTSNAPPAARHTVQKLYSLKGKR